MTVSKEDLEAARAAMKGAGMVTTSDQGQQQSTVTDAPSWSITAALMWLLCAASAVAAFALLVKAGDYSASSSYAQQPNALAAAILYNWAIGSAISSAVFGAMAAIAADAKRARVAAEQTLDAIRAMSPST